MSLKLKLTALVGLSLSLVVTTACMQPKQAEKKVKEACNQVARICKDGSNAVRASDNSCYQSCPEDTSTETATVTSVSTVTATQTQMQ